MRFKCVETFYWVATIGNFHAVAERMNTTQPAISARIHALEDELGVALFDRTPRYTRLNSAGRRFLVYAERYMALADEVEQTFRHKDKIAHIVRIGVSETIANTWFMDFIAEVNRLYPRLSIEMESDTSINLRDQVLRNEIDMAFLLGPIAEPSMENHFLCHCRFQWVAIPSFPLPRRRLAAGDLAGQTIITFPRKTPIFDRIHAALKASGTSDVKIHCSTSIRTILHMTLQGWGLAALPSEIVAENLARRALRRVDLDIEFGDLTYTSSYLRTPNATLYESLSTIARDIAKRATKGTADRPRLTQVI
jgi:DNA-binding transcriptional LysR family regulator